MIHAIDSSILVDILHPDPRFGPASRDLLRCTRRNGALVACGVVYAEVGALFATPEAFTRQMFELEIDFSPLSAVAAWRAGQMWKFHRRRNPGRSRMIADFLIGAHALDQADALLTRDRGFYRAYFSGLRIMDPTLSH